MVFYYHGTTPDAAYSIARDGKMLSPREQKRKEIALWEKSYYEHLIDMLGVRGRNGEEILDKICWADGASYDEICFTSIFRDALHFRGTSGVVLRFSFEGIREQFLRIPKRLSLNVLDALLLEPQVFERHGEKISIAFIRYTPRVICVGCNSSPSEKAKI